MKEKLKQTLELYIEKVNQKMQKEDFDTNTVHEDIRIMHHIVKIINEMNNSTPSKL